MKSYILNWPSRARQIFFIHPPPSHPPYSLWKDKLYFPSCYPTLLFMKSYILNRPSRARQIFFIHPHADWNFICNLKIELCSDRISLQEANIMDILVSSAAPSMNRKHNIIVFSTLHLRYQITI